MSDQGAAMTSTKPYLIRAIYDWILDNGMTPHLVVDAGYPEVRVPQEFVADGRIVLNILPSAVRELVIGNDWISFNARFGGVAREVLVPAEAVLGIFTRENGQGMVFPETPSAPRADATNSADAEVPRQGTKEGSSDSKSDSTRDSKGKGGGPRLKVVK